MAILFRYGGKSILALLFICFDGLANNQSDVEIEFLGWDLVIPAIADRPSSIGARSRSITKALESFDEVANQTIINVLDSAKLSLNLNDWAYFKLIRTYASTYKRNENYTSFLMWYFLGKSGYKSYLYFEKNKFSVYIESDEDVFDLPRIGKRYCLNCTDQVEQVTFSGLNYFSTGKSFEFAIDRIPLMKEPQIVKKNIIIHSNLLLKSFSVDFTINRSWVTFLESYPNVELSKLYRTPLSVEAQSLIVRLKSITENMTTVDAIRLLLSFTRNLSDYTPDEQLFDREKWMTPEEALFYPSGDCDDKSSLFYYLVKEVLNLQPVILIYDKADHVNVAIQLEGLGVPNLVIDDNPYYICETTDSSDLEDIGENTLHTKYKYRILK